MGPFSTGPLKRLLGRPPLFLKKKRAYNNYSPRGGKIIGGHISPRKGDKITPFVGEPINFPPRPQYYSPHIL